MKRCKKTYAIYHLTEKHTTFHLGKTRVHVSFTGGIVTKKGVTPATFTTDDPVVQLAIELSADFKKGAIKTVAQYMLEEDVKIGRNPTPEENANKDKGNNATEASSKPNGDTERADTATPPLSDEVESDKKEDDAPAESNATEGLEVVDASCKDAAKAYLQDHYGENPARLRTREQVQECAARHGITFNFV